MTPAPHDLPGALRHDNLCAQPHDLPCALPHDLPCALPHDLPRALPHDDALLAVARRVVWYKPPAETLGDVPLFVAHLLTYSTPHDVEIARRYLSDADLRRALDLAPPGVFDARSWTYWNLILGRDPAPPMPVRVIPEPGPSQAAE